MKVFKDIRFYLGAGFLIALVSIMWSLPMDLNAAGASGEALPDMANDKAKAKAPDDKHPMAGIIGKRGVNINKKNREIRAYLTGKYKTNREYGASAKGRSYGYGSIVENISISGDFTPPGYAKRADVDEDIRARSRAFLEEEKELFGFSDLQSELRGGKHVRTERTVRVRKTVRYSMAVEGLPVSGSTFYFVFTEDGKPVMMDASLRPVSPEMRAAAKRFKAEGTTADDIKEAVMADLVKRGLPQGNIDRLKFKIGPQSFLVEEEPYAVWSTVVWYPEYEEDYGYWGYEFNAVTGELISRESQVSFEEE